MGFEIEHFSFFLRIDICRSVSPVKTQLHDDVVQKTLHSIGPHAPAASFRPNRLRSAVTCHTSSLVIAENITINMHTKYIAYTYAEQDQFAKHRYIFIYK